MKTSVRSLGIFSAVTAFLSALWLLLLFLSTFAFVVAWYKKLIIIILVHLVVLYGLILSNAVQKQKQNLTLVLSFVWIILLTLAGVAYLVVNSR
jgi:hypothetical protein